MNGRKSFRWSPEEMKVIKTLFPDKPLERRKKRSQQILSQNNSVKTQGMKNEIMKFLGFSKIWDENSQNIFHFKNFFFFLKIYFERKFSPDFGKPQKFHDFIFFIP